MRNKSFKKFLISGRRLHRLYRDVENDKIIISSHENCGKIKVIDELTIYKYQIQLNKDEHKYKMYRHLCKKNPLIEFLLMK